MIAYKCQLLMRYFYKYITKIYGLFDFAYADATCLILEGLSKIPYNTTYYFNHKLESNIC